MRRALAGLITRFTFWLDMTAAIKLPGAINKLAARIDNFTERHIWSLDEHLAKERGFEWPDAEEYSFADAPKPIPFTPDELYGSVKMTKPEQQEEE